MAGQRQPVDLIIANGKKHLTKAEIEERRNTEIKAPADKVTAPQYLSKDQKKSFKRIVKELQKVGIVANLDVDALARLVISQSNYLAITREMDETPLMIEGWRETGKKDDDGRDIYEKTMLVNPNVERLARLQDKFFRQCRQGAADFGLTVASRCRLVAPSARGGGEKKNKFVSRFA